MTYLFDTNAWLRLAECPEEISSTVRQQLSASQVPFGLSVISIWEVGLKVRKGKLRLTLPFDAWLPIMLRPSLVTVLPLDAASARLTNELPGQFHEDPADRMIVATAINAGLTVVTSDHLILGYTHVRSLDTR